MFAVKHLKAATAPTLRAPGPKLLLKRLPLASFSKERVICRAVTETDDDGPPPPLMVGAADFADWESKWVPIFNEIDSNGTRIDHLDIDLDDAIAEEDYKRAAGIKAEIEALEAKDLYLTLEDEMNAAVDTERYDEASRIRDRAMMGMVGWWRGRFDTDAQGRPCDDHTGHLVKIDYAYGKLLGKMYNAKDISASKGLIENPQQAGLDIGQPIPLDSLGIPLLEFFLTKAEDGAIQCQPVFLTASEETVAEQAAAAAAALAPEAGFVSDDEGGAVSDVESALDTAILNVERERLLGEGFLGRPMGRGVFGGAASDDESGSESEGEEGREDPEVLDRVAAAAEMEALNDVYERHPAQLRILGRNEFELCHPPRSLASLPEFTLGAPGEFLSGDASGVVRGLDRLYRGESAGQAAEAEASSSSSPSSSATGLGPSIPSPPSSPSPRGGKGAVGGSMSPRLDGPGPSSASSSSSSSSSSSGGPQDGGDQGSASASADSKAQFNVSIAGDSLDLTKLQRLTEKDVRVSANFTDEQRAALGLTPEDIQRLSQGIAEYTVKKVQEEVARSASAGESLSKEGLARAIRDAVEELLIPETRARTAPAAAGALSPAAAAAAADPSALSAPEVPRRARYTRVLDESAPTDPFSGLFLGSFGPHGPELLQLSRGKDEDGEEQIVAVKLTGDPNVPANAVSFRARIGRKHRLSPRGVYPEELGVVGRYKGQGRVAQYGYVDARWVDGELLVFSGRGTEFTGSAELGFVWHVPGDRKFLILLNRVQLD